jgi:4'-phosphopantetheinyl transferase
MPATTDQRWMPAPSHPRAAEGVLDVWRVNLATVVGRTEESLCAEERARAERLLSERDRLLWTRSRGILRALLARYLRLDPRTLRFSLGEHGKPTLDTPVATPLRFNLSHSDGIALYAVSVGRSVGIDVQVARRPIDELAIAARVLGRAEAERLGAMDPTTRTREFLRAWVAHEATMKCRGTGLAVPPGGSPTAEVWTAELDVGPRAAAAVVVEGGPCELRRWQWSGWADQ